MLHKHQTLKIIFKALKIIFKALLKKIKKEHKETESHFENKVVK